MVAEYIIQMLWDFGTITRQEKKSRIKRPSKSSSQAHAQKSSMQRRNTAIQQANKQEARLENNSDVNM
jgi:hypothetical protein